MKSNSRCFILGVLICAPYFVGCKPAPPEIVKASGVVSINDEPLPNATVSFVPMAEGLNGSHKSSGTSDAEGKFTLSLYSGEGVYAGLNKVTIQEGPAPDEARSMDADGAKIWSDYKATLKNRPIPKKYMSIGQTPLAFEVTPDKTEYLIKIKR